MNTLTQIKHPAMNVVHRMQTPDLLKSTIALVLDFDQITSWLYVNQLERNTARGTRTKVSASTRGIDLSCVCLTAAWTTNQTNQVSTGH